MTKTNESTQVTVEEVLEVENPKKGNTAKPKKSTRRAKSKTKKDVKPLEMKETDQELTTNLSTLKELENFVAVNTTEEIDNPLNKNVEAIQAELGLDEVAPESDVTVVELVSEIDRVKMTKKHGNPVIERFVKFFTEAEETFLNSTELLRSMKDFVKGYKATLSNELRVELNNLLTTAELAQKSSKEFPEAIEGALTALVVREDNKLEQLVLEPVILPNLDLPVPEFAELEKAMEEVFEEGMKAIVQAANLPGKISIHEVIKEDTPAQKIKAHDHSNMPLTAAELQALYIPSLP